MHSCGLLCSLMLFFKNCFCSLFATFTWVSTHAFNYGCTGSKVQPAVLECPFLKCFSLVLLYLGPYLLLLQNIILNLFTPSFTLIYHVLLWLCYNIMQNEKKVYQIIVDQQKAQYYLWWTKRRKRILILHSFFSHNNAFQYSQGRLPSPKLRLSWCLMINVWSLLYNNT